MNDEYPVEQKQDFFEPKYEEGVDTGCGTGCLICSLLPVVVGLYLVWLFLSGLSWFQIAVIVLLALILIAISKTGKR
jgi:hypothetical protein